MPVTVPRPLPLEGDPESPPKNRNNPVQETRIPQKSNPEAIRICPIQEKPRTMPNSEPGLPKSQRT